MPAPIHPRRALWLRGVLDLAVLALLARRERYGYELTSALAGAGLGRITGGTLYPLLARLSDDGLVRGRWRAGTKGPGRKYYESTERGRALLAERAPQWRAFAAAVVALVETDHGGPMPDHASYLTALSDGLRAEGVPEADIEEIVREAASHLDAADEPPEAALGPVNAFVAAVVSRGAPAPAGARWEYRTITGATAANELRLLEEAGREGWQLTGCGPLALHVRRPAVGAAPIEHVRHVGGPSRDDRMAAEGWQLATTWMIFRYYRRPRPA